MTAIAENPVCKNKISKVMNIFSALLLNLGNSHFTEFHKALKKI